MVTASRELGKHTGGLRPCQGLAALRNLNPTNVSNGSFPGITAPQQ
jgi:hypothetical protein